MQYLHADHLQHRASLSVFSSLSLTLINAIHVATITGLCFFFPHMHSDLNGTALIRTFSLWQCQTSQFEDWSDSSVLISQLDRVQQCSDDMACIWEVHSQISATTPASLLFGAFPQLFHADPSVLAQLRSYPNIYQPSHHQWCGCDQTTC